MSPGSVFSLSRVFVVESLEPHEKPTGRQVYELIGSSEHAAELGVSVEYHDCDNALEFTSLIRRLSADVSATGRVPILHVECHGDRAHGLEFKNGPD
jgi:hypothetical protein